jgi:hypothetical protein
VSDRRRAGQAAAEYVAVLLVVGAALAGAATAAFALPGLGGAVVRTVRTGLCIVGGDLCRSADAAAAGLAPCVTAERTARQETTLDLAVVRLGGNGEWQLALRSDGGATVTRLEETDAGGVIGVGAELGPLAASVETAAVASYRGGKAWTFGDARAAAAFVDGAMHDAAVQDARAPDVRWVALAGGASGEAGVALAELAGAGLAIGGSSAIGLRRERARRTITLDLRLDGLELAGHLPGFPRPGGGRRALVADITWEAGELRELALRTAVAHGARQEETTARVDLREPGALALAERLLRPGTGTADDLRAVADHAAAHGVVERNTYATSERRRGVSLGARLGLSLAFSHERIRGERRLEGATVWIRGGPPQRRLDCLDL